MLSKALQKLSEQAIEALRRPSSQHFCRPVLVRKRRPIIQDFKYEAGQAVFNIEPRYVERKEWSLTDQYRFINQKIKTLSSYAHCADELAKSHNITLEHLEPRLTRYLQVLLSAYFSEQSKAVAGPLSQAFLHDLEGEPISWAVKGALRGVALDAEQCRFGKYTLRQPVAGDFEVEQSIADNIPHPLCATPPSAILEFETWARDQYGVRQEYTGVLTLLRLFRLGSVHSIALASTPRSVLQMAGVLYSGGGAPAPYVYTLGNRDQGLLGRFLERHLGCATTLEGMADTESKDGLICLAYKTYTLALRGQGPADSPLLLALACIEALLLKSDERGDLRSYHLLARRLGNLLCGCGVASESVTKLLEEAYELRATRRHRPEPFAIEARAVAKLSRKMLNYARMTLITLSQAPRDTSTVALIEMLDKGSRSVWNLMKNPVVPP